MTQRDIRWKSGWDAESAAADRAATDIDFSHDEGKTIQAPAEEHDINVIMKRFGVKDGSILPAWRAPASMYGDVSDMPNNPFEVAQTLRNGDMAFQMLPADIRRRFGTGPELYQWLSDPKNAEEAVKLGLLQKKMPEPPIERKIATAIDEQQKATAAEAAAKKKAAQEAAQSTN